MSTMIVSFFSLTEKETVCIQFLVKVASFVVRTTISLRLSDAIIDGINQVLELFLRFFLRAKFPRRVRPSRSSRTSRKTAASNGSSTTC